MKLEEFGGDAVGNDGRTSGKLPETNERDSDIEVGMK